MFETLDTLNNRYNELVKLLNDPKVISNSKLRSSYMEEYNKIAHIIEKYSMYKQISSDLNDARQILQENSDEELCSIAKDEVKSCTAELKKLDNEIKILLLPEYPNDKKNVIVEIRSGAGGDEASLFVGDLFRMYMHYAESKKWHTEILSISENGIGGFKEVIFIITGNKVYSRLKYESGVHRVQRVPTTESSGRIHTSTITVAILPEAEEVDVIIKPDDLRIDVFRSSGNGGQSVNTTDSAVRVTHIPSGMVVSCQDEKSQLKNKDKAIKILRARLYDLEQEKQKSKLSLERKTQVGTGDRSERIRTYNFPQGRVTDHRINLTLYRLNDILNGNIDELVDALAITEQSKRLNNTTI